MFDTKIYLSGSFVHESLNDIGAELGIYRLCSYAYPKHAHDYLSRAAAVGKRANMMIDSGAFTSWSLGKKVEMHKLIDYNLKLMQEYPNADYLFIALDVIPGEKGRHPTQTEIENAVQHSYYNFHFMLDAMPRCKILPVYHSGEDRALRNKYLEYADYICLSMNQEMKTTDRVRWASEAIVPGFRYHGLAATGNQILTEIDWFSVDSASWLMFAISGDIFIPVGTKLKMVQVSDKAKGRMKEDMHHINSMPEAPQIKEYISSLGFEFDKLATDYVERCKWNMVLWHSNPPWRKRLTHAMRLFD